MTILERAINKLYSVDSCESYEDTLFCVKEAIGLLELSLLSMSCGLASTEVASIIDDLSDFNEFTDIAEAIHELELINMEI